jgi:hypothetical protein
MGSLLFALQVILSVISLVCYILVIVQMLQHGQTGLAVACIIGLFICGIGGLVTFIVGWMRANEWGIRNIMLAWTGCIVAGFILGLIAPPQLPFLQTAPAR